MDKRKKRNIVLIVIAVLTLIAGIGIEQSFYNELSNKKISRQAQRYISDQSETIDEYIGLVSSYIQQGQSLWTLEVPSKYHIYVSSRDKLLYWTTNRISPQNIPFSKYLTCHTIDNAWFLYRSEIVGNLRIDVMVNIKNNYPINNNYFNNEDVSLGELSQYKLSDHPEIGYTSVLGANQQPLFYFSKTELNDHNRRHSLLASLIYTLFFILIIIIAASWNRTVYINLLTLIVVASTFILLVRYANIIPLFSKAYLFTETIYVSKGVFSSLVIMVLGGLFWGVLSHVLSKNIKYLKPNAIQAIGGVLIMVVLFYTYMLRYIDILHNTDINLELFKIRYITKETMWIYFTLLLYIGGWIRLAVVLTGTFHKQKYAILYPLIVFILCIPILEKCPLPIISSTLMLLLTILYLRRTHAARYMMAHLVVISILLSAATTIITEQESYKRNHNNKEALIQSLPATLLQEKNLRVEEQLNDIWQELQADQTLQSIPMTMFNSQEYYSTYLENKYLQGHLKEYELQIVICTPESYLHIGGVNTPPNCYAYFSDMLKSEGEKVKNTGFYWQRNNNGRVSYFGWLKVAKGSLLETSVFIDLESPILSEGRGYPELLRDKYKNKNSMPQQYSFARYVDGRLITSSGDFRYPSSTKWIDTTKGLINSFDFDKHTHLYNKVSDSTIVLISELKPTILYPLYAFIYTFLLFYFCFVIVYIFTNKVKFKLKRTMSHDIRYVIYTILLISLLLVGSASVFFPISIYSRNQDKQINEKSESIMIALSNEFNYINDISEVPKLALQNFLLSLSNTLQVDINVYDVEGSLYATSRPQLFDYKLQGNIMCPKAFYHINHLSVTSRMHEEYIGSNQYKSNYFTVANGSEKTIAYINIPFFTSHEDLQRSIWDYLVVLLNIYLLLVISVTIITYISINTITKPLSIIEAGLDRMKLGKNEKIIYHRDDEIGVLVKKYNIMVDQLGVSVNKLAQNEREVAWQRMARQIAHEIKNPLTPMKLSIQHLVRTKSGSPEDFNNYFNKTAKTLVEQIDNLSNIASSFSTFAKISDAVPEHLCINERIQNIVTLFEQSGAKISFVPLNKDVEVYMDRVHFIQIFNNLIKNALQAIPEELDGIISISLVANDQFINVNIEDNGCGIDLETQEKIFQPNFTTKNSGMGLGLAISQKMANNANGNITFISELGIGTTFTVQIPIAKT